MMKKNIPLEKSQEEGQGLKKSTKKSTGAVALGGGKVPVVEKGASG